jgi:sugar-phosphatase
VFATVECEAAVFGCRTVRPDLASLVPSVLALPGADHVLDALPTDRWALLADEDETALRRAFTAVALPTPPVVVAPGGPGGVHTEVDYEAAASALGADPHVCLAFEDTAAGIDAARAAGLQVIGVAPGDIDPAGLAAADLVVPTLLSVRVLGAHPFVVLEVDAIPDLGTGAARRR